MFSYSQKKSRCLTQGGGCWQQETEEGHKDPASQSDRNSPYINSHMDYMGECICQNV